MNDIEQMLSEYDAYQPIRMGFASAIDRSLQAVREVSKLAYATAIDDGTVCTTCSTKFRDLQPVLRLERGESLCLPCAGKAPKLAEFGTVEPAISPIGKAIRYMGALGQAWKAPELGVPQKPSSLGQLLLLGSLGAAAGYGTGKLLNKVAPNDYIDFTTPGLVAGAALGSLPGASSAYFNYLSEKPVWTESFWDSPDLQPKTASNIPVDRFQDILWSNMATASRLPPTIQAAASGLVQGAANLPGKHTNATFVSPMDIARMAVGLGGGAAAGYLFGKTIGNVLGMSRKAQNLIIGSGAFAGMLNTLTPRVYGEN